MFAILFYLTLLAPFVQISDICLLLKPLCCVYLGESHIYLYFHGKFYKTCICNPVKFMVSVAQVPKFASNLMLQIVILFKIQR